MFLMEESGMKNKVLNLLALILNIAIVGLGIYSLINLFVISKAQGLVYFTTISAILIVAIALIGIVYNILILAGKHPKNYLAFMICKLVIVTTGLVSIFVTLVFVGPKDLVDSQFMILRLIVPILALIEYLFFALEPKVKWKYTFYVLIPFSVYVIIIASLVAGKIIDAPYSYIDVSTNVWYVNLFLAVIAICGVYLIGLGTWALNKMMNLIIIGYDYKESEDDGTSELSEQQTQEAVKEIEAFVKAEGLDEEETEEVDTNQEESKSNINQSDVEDVKAKSVRKNAKESSKKSDEKVEQKQNIPQVTYTKKYNQRVYHISRQKLVGKWQVKLAGSDKVIKFFDTQLEAINFAKALVKTQGGSIRIHSVVGKMRKG